MYRSRCSSPALPTIINRLNFLVMEKKYQINGYQLIYTDGQRDSIKLLSPEMVDDIEEYRESVKREHQCMYVNLTYTEISK